MTKYHAKRCTIDNINFDSIAESNRYQELKLLEMAGEIHNLQVHPKFVVWEHFDPSKLKTETICYIADFAYLEDGKIVVEDVKGKRLPIYLLKLKMFKAKYPEIDFREIKA